MERYEKMMRSNIQTPKAESSVKPETSSLSPMGEASQQSQAPLQFIPDESQEYSNNDLINAAKTTVNWEGRRDRKGNLSVYALPAGDMGGDYEVAGINDRYHPEAFRKIASLPAQDREAAAAQYINQYTAPLVSQLPQAIQPFVQDLAFNRGMGGATKYLQEGLNSLGVKVAVDGAIGPKTLSAIGNVNPKELMVAASQAQLNDEKVRAAADPRRKKFILGLENRINNRLSAFGG
jgi:hypothetical protein